MSNLRNSVKLIGHLGIDPELKTLSSGKKLTNVRLATNDSYKNSEGQYVQNTQWHTIVAWGKLAEIMAKHFQKGKEVAVEGKLVHRSFEDKDGQTKYVTEIVASQVMMLGKKN